MGVTRRPRALTSELVVAMRAKISAALKIPEDGAHLEEALTHPSYRNERPGIRDNQRLEFLGDAVLGFCTSELLYARFPDADEGELTRMRADLVNAAALARWAQENGVAEALRLGRGAAAHGLAASENVLADAVEALIAAAYLDGGMEAARAACARVVEPGMRGLRRQSRDPKSELQERVQARGAPAPRYCVIGTGGPAHAPWFEVTVSVGDQLLGQGRGRSKRLAERSAASAALATGACEEPEEELQ